MKKLFYVLSSAILLVSCNPQIQNVPKDTVTGLDIGIDASKELEADQWERTNLKEYTVFDFVNATDSTVLAATSRGLFFSKDDGKSWKKTQNEFLQNKKITCLENGKNYILAGVSEKGIYKSEDKGLTWKLVNSGLEVPGIIIKDITCEKKIDYAATNKGLFISYTRGESWEEVRNGFPLIKDTQIPVGVNTVLISGKIVFALTDVGIVLSKDAGNTWETPVQKDVAIKTMLANFRANPKNKFTGRFFKEGFYYSPDHGKTWKNSDLEGINIIKVYISPNGILYTGASQNGVYRSVDNGNKWYALNNGLPRATSVYTFNITKVGTVLVGTNGKGIFRLIN